MLLLCSGPGVGMLSKETLVLRDGSFERPCSRIGIASAEQAPVLALVSHPTSGWDGQLVGNGFPRICLPVALPAPSGSETCGFQQLWQLQVTLWLPETWEDEEEQEIQESVSSLLWFS